MPTKLQGITNNRNGNFAVMHIDLPGTKPSDRNAAAKRTSEETEAQARRANQIGWQPVRRTKSAWHNDELDSQRARTSDTATPPSRTTAPTSTHTATTAAATAATSTTGAASEWLQTRIPPPRETKAEQARLLTLLRTLHPILVVDQLCKALAYFGGIPGAPSPTDGAFPSGAVTNGPGSLLVSWLAEIFPPVDDPAAVGQHLNLPPLSFVAGQTGWDRPEATAAGAPPNGPVRRARGRPKGSKSSKVRKDKGMKKSRPPPSTANPSGPQDVNQPMLADGRDPGNGPPSSVANNAAQPTTATALSEAPAGNQVNPGTNTMSTPGAKKRGRPKGSKNRPKDKTDASKWGPDRSVVTPAAKAQSSTSPMPHPSNAAQGPPAMPEIGQNGPAVAHGLSGSAPRNEPSLPAPAADTASLADNGSAPSTYTDCFPQRDSQQESNLVPNTAKRPAQYDGPAPPDGTASRGYSAAQSMGSVPQDQPTKRRRISKETGQQPGMGMESQTLPPDVTASPALSHGFSSASPQLSASRSFESHKATNRQLNATMGASLGVQQQQQHQHQLHQQQQQPQRFYAQQSQHPSPSVSASDQHPHGAVQTSVPPRPRSQMAGAYGAQRPAQRSPQMIYTQQRQPQSQSQPPMSKQMGPLSHHSASLGRSTSGGQFSHGPGRQILGGRGAGVIRGHQPRGGAVQAHGFNGHQHQQASSQPDTMGSFQGFNEQSYLNMDYGLTERDVQDAAAVTALGSPSQHKMRDHHMFQSIGRQ